MTQWTVKAVRIGDDTKYQVVNSAGRIANGHNHNTQGEAEHHAWVCNAFHEDWIRHASRKRS